MPYAISNEGKSLRAVSSPEDLLDGEEFSLELPAPQVVDSTEQQWRVLRATAASRLSATNDAVLQCFEDGSAVPSAMKIARAAWRSIVNAETGDPTAVNLPSIPT